MLEPDGYDGYEGGAPYWFLPSGAKTYSYYEAKKAHDSYFYNEYKNAINNDKTRRNRKI